MDPPHDTAIVCIMARLNSHHDATVGLQCAKEKLSIWFRREAISFTYCLDPWLTTNIMAADAHYARTVQRFSIGISVQHAVIAIVHGYYINSVGTNSLIILIVVSLFCF